MTRLLLTLLAVLTVMTQQANDAQACACRNQVPKRLVSQADQVVLARAVAQTAQAGGQRTDFEVLHSIKGESLATFQWIRPFEGGRCAPIYRVGEVSLLFIHGGTLPSCVGNEYFSSRVGKFSDYLQNGGPVGRSLTPREVRAALETTLPGSLENQPTITAYYDPMAAHEIMIRDTRFRFCKTGKWKGELDEMPVDALIILDATRWKDIVSMSAIYPKRGLIIRVLLQDTGEGFEILFRDVIER